MVSKYKTGMVVEFQWNSFISNAIKKFDESEWSHVGIITKVDETNGKVIMFESRMNGPEFKEYGIEELRSYESNKNAFAFMPNYPKGTKLTSPIVTAIAAKYDGEKYGFASYPAIVLFLVLQKAGFKNILWNALFAQSESERGWLHINLRGVICSELVARMLYDISGGKINYEEALGKPWEITSPGDIYSLRDHKW